MCAGRRRYGNGLHAVERHLRKRLLVRGIPCSVGEFAPRSPTIKPTGRNRFEVVHLDGDGTYDDSDAYLLPRSSAWHAISTFLLPKGGHFVEAVPLRGFAEALLERGEYRPESDAVWVEPGQPLACVQNASRAAERNRSARLQIGLGLHYSDGTVGGGMYWTRHTYLTVPRLLAPGGRAIWEVTELPAGYYGWSADESWWRRWVEYAGATLREEVNANGR